jgi:hypothetical protein
VVRTCKPVNEARADRFRPFPSVFTVYFQISKRLLPQKLDPSSFFAIRRFPKTAETGRKRRKTVIELRNVMARETPIANHTRECAARPNMGNGVRSEPRLIEDESHANAHGETAR